MNKLSITVIAAIAAAALFAIPAHVSAQSDYGVNDFTSEGADEFSVEKMRRMVLEEEGGGTAGAGGEAAAAQEEFVPKNEITIIPQKPEVDTGAGKKEKAKKEKAAKKDAVPGEKIGNTFGLRFGIGPTWGIALGVGLGLSESGRVDIGMNMGLGEGRHGYDQFLIEAAGFYDMRFKLSDDAALCWYVGPGVAFGWYGTSKDTTVMKLENVTRPGDTATTIERTPVDTTFSPGGFNVGIGFHIGLEVDLQFIDIEHSLSFLRGSVIGLDFRPVLYPAAWSDKGELRHFHSVAWNFGISFKMGLGGKKSGGG